jgi:hypothetical protein
MDMKDKRNLHVKLQELADCFASADPLEEMASLVRDEDKDEAALKWLALAVLHGVNRNAEKIKVTRSPSGDVKAVARYRETELPSPGADIGQRMTKAVREVTHLEGEKAESPLAFGIQDSSIEIDITMKQKDDGEKLTLRFPDVFK